MDVLKQANDHRERIVYYLLFLIALEFVLRLTLSVVAFLISERNRLLRGHSAAVVNGEVTPPPEDPASPEEAEPGDEAPLAQQDP